MKKVNGSKISLSLFTSLISHLVTHEFMFHTKMNKKHYSVYFRNGYNGRK